MKFLQIIDGEWCGYYIFAGQAIGGGATEKQARCRRHEMALPDNQAPVSIYECNKTSDSGWSTAGPLSSSPSAASRGRGLRAVPGRHHDAGLLATDDDPAPHGPSPQAFGDEKTRRFKIGGTNYEFAGADGQQGEQYRLMELANKLPDTILWPSTSPPHQGLPARHPDRQLGGGRQRLQGQAWTSRTPSASSTPSPTTSPRRRRQPAPRLPQRARRGHPHRRRAVHRLSARVGGAGTKPIGIKWDDVKDFGNLIKAVRKFQIDTDYLMMADAATKYLQEPIMAPGGGCGEHPPYRQPRGVGGHEAGRRWRPTPLFVQQDVELIMDEMGITAMQQNAISPDQVMERLQGGETLPPGADPVLVGYGADQAAGGGGNRAAPPSPAGADGPASSPSRSRPCRPRASTDEARIGVRAAAAARCTNGSPTASSTGRSACSRPSASSPTARRIPSPTTSRCGSGRNSGRIPLHRQAAHQVPAARPPARRGHVQEVVQRHGPDRARVRRVVGQGHARAPTCLKTRPHRTGRRGGAGRAAAFLQ